MIRVLQIDSDQDFCNELEDYCSRIHDFAYERRVSGYHAFDSMQRPEIILVDMEVEPEGGLAVLATLRRRWSSAEVKVILLAKQPPTESELRAAAARGADYFLLHPVDLVVLERRIRQMWAAVDKPLKRQMTLEQVQRICAGYFERIGLPPNYKGYRYLMTGIWLASLHPSWLNAVTQDLYPAIGQRFGVSGARVERAMRYALDITWEKGNIEQLHELFPYVRESKGKPTNSTFIAKMADLVGIEASRHG